MSMLSAMAAKKITVTINETHFMVTNSQFKTKLSTFNHNLITNLSRAVDLDNLLLATSGG